MNKNFCLVIFFIFLIGCSIDNKSGIWSKNEKIKSANQYKDIIFEDNKEVYLSSTFFILYFSFLIISSVLVYYQIERKLQRKIRTLYIKQNN